MDNSVLKINNASGKEPIIEIETPNKIVIASSIKLELSLPATNAQKTYVSCLPFTHPELGTLLCIYSSIKYSEYLHLPDIFQSFKMQTNTSYAL